MQTNPTKMTKLYVSSKGLFGEIRSSLDGAIVIDKYKVNVERKQLLKIGEFCLKSKVKVEIVTAASVEETLTGQVIPVVLIKSNVKESLNTCYIVFVDFEKDQCIPLRKFELDSKFIHGNEDTPVSKSGNVFILNGPCVLVCYKSKLLIYHVIKEMVLEEFSFNISCFKECLSVCCQESKIKVRYRLLQNETFHDKIILFLLIQMKTKCMEHGYQEKHILKALQFSEGQFTIQNTRCFIPEEYEECVRSICFKSLEHVDSQMFYSELYLGTSEGCIIHVRNGYLVHCANISENASVSCLKLGMTVDINGDSHLLAETEDSWIELTSNLQIEKKYSGIENIVHGDFCQNGSLQFLLLKEDLAKESPWILTDLRWLCVTSDGDEIDTQKQSPKSSGTAIKALKARLQREQVLLHDEEVQLRLQADFVSDIFAKQSSIAAGSSWKQQSPQCMVNLIKGPELECQGQRGQSQTGSEPAVEVKGHWQRTYGDSWCVGVDMANKSDRTSRVWLDVVLEESCSRIVTMESSCLTLPQIKTGALCDQGMSAATSSIGNQSSRLVYTKRQKSSASTKLKFDSSTDIEKIEGQGLGERAEAKEGTVVCVLPLPVFGSSNSVAANLILNWTFLESKKEVNEDMIISDGGLDKGEEGGGKEGTGKEDQKQGRIYTYCCGKVVLTAKDVLGAKYELNFHEETGTEDADMAEVKDLRNSQITWRHVQTIHHLVVKGSPGLLARFESLLADTCGFVYNHLYDCFVTMVKALHRVQVQLAAQTCDENRELIVYTRDIKDLFLTIHHLYAHLPDHVVILANADISKKCLPALQKEADFLSHGLRKLLSDQEEENASLDLDDEDDIRKVGEKFKRRQKEMLKSKNDSLKNEKVRLFIEQYKRIQERTDSVMLTFAS